MSFLVSLFGSYSKRELKRVQPIVDKVLSLEDKFSEMTDDELKAQTAIFKERLEKGESLDDILPEAFATVREASWRVLGMKHFPVQVIGGVVLHQGRIAEMRTGEGKTLVATLPAYLNALSGKGVHIVTVNDYLARRDSEWMGKIYKFLGLTVGLITHDQVGKERTQAYDADITYGTNNEFGFDYLRDNMVAYKEQKVQRGHNFAIVDEVDSILIDEARTPLIISGQGDKSTDLYEKADVLARRLVSVKVKETNDKEDNDAIHVDADYIIDEKAKTCTLTPSGVEKAEFYFGVENLMDVDHMPLLHHINQAIKAHGVMQLDVDYVVKDNEVIIVDEFTGRLMFGRRYNEGLHQAIEAKEGVKIARESKNLATITFQNYFRMYGKLSGMTGTAMTEADEFRQIYRLDVVDIPTNRPAIRNDLNDVFYKTENAKFNAVIDRVVEAHKKGQPVLVGTVNIDKSELLSKMLKRKGIEHEVLNAKHHEREADIVSQAGKKGAVTIATNMAGRGTDIMLGGNPEHMAKTEMRKMGISEELISEATGFSETTNADIIEARKTFQELERKYKNEIKDDAEAVRAAGGLLILGTERHESRRIDNQLRGRSGRQGDPGESQFYLSGEDDLVRLFGGDRISAIMETLNVDENLPIDAKMISNVVESAQRRVEGRNFAIRKDVLRFDEVMNKQREIIYGQRDRVLNNEDLIEEIRKMVKKSVEHIVPLYITKGGNVEDWNLEGLVDYYKGWVLEGDELTFTEDELDRLEYEYVENLIVDKALSIYDSQREAIGDDLFGKVEQKVLLELVDAKWMDHIDAMEELKRGIYLRSYAQKDPVAMYTIEGFDMFDDLNASICSDTVRIMLTIKRGEDQDITREQVAKPTMTSGGGDGSDNTNRTVRKGNKVGRNDPCPCGSGKKYKKCCGANE